MRDKIPKRLCRNFPGKPFLVGKCLFLNTSPEEEEEGTEELVQEQKQEEHEGKYTRSSLYQLSTYNHGLRMDLYIVNLGNQEKGSESPSPTHSHSLLTIYLS